MNNSLGPLEIKDPFFGGSSLGTKDTKSQFVTFLDLEYWLTQTSSCSTRLLSQLLTEMYLLLEGVSIWRPGYAAIYQDTS